MSLLLTELLRAQVKSPELFDEWVSKLRHHRVFRQNEIAMYPHERHLFYPHASPSLNESMRKVGEVLTKASLSLDAVEMFYCLVFY